MAERIKICIRCGESKQITDFFQRRDSKDGYRNTCKECSKFWTKKKKENKQIISSFKQSHGCYICGESDPICLEFHHLNSNEKEFGIATQSNMKKVFKEIKKCIVVCRNCHAKIHKYGLHMVKK